MTKISKFMLALSTILISECYKHSLLELGGLCMTTTNLVFFIRLFFIFIDVISLILILLTDALNVLAS